MENTEATKEQVKRVSVRLVAILVIFALVFGFLALITKEIVLEDEKGFDKKAFQIIGGLKSRDATNIFSFLTFFGSTNFLFPAYLLLALYFLIFKKNRRRSVNIGVVGLGSAGLLHLMKNIFQRQRPSEPLISKVSGFSFPSGHSFSTFTLCGLLIYVIWQTEARPLTKWLISIVLFIFGASVALSRVYLRVHYASDVIAGFCLSFLWLVSSIYVLEKLTKKQTV